MTTIVDSSAVRPNVVSGHKVFTHLVVKGVGLGLEDSVTERGRDDSSMENPKRIRNVTRAEIGL